LQQGFVLRGNLGNNLLKNPRFYFCLSFFGVKNEAFVLFQFRGNVAFCVNQGLLANVFRRNLGGVGFGNFQIITKYFVVTDLK